MSLNTKPVARLRDDVEEKLEHVSFTLDIIVLAKWSWEAKVTDSNEVLVFAAIWMSPPWNIFLRSAKRRLAERPYASLAKGVTTCGSMLWTDNVSVSRCPSFRLVL